MVTSARSLLQPMTPRLGDIEPLTLAVGDEVAFEEVITRLVELAYTRPTWSVGAGSSRCAGNTRRVSADRRTPGAHRVLGRRGHRDAHVLGRRSALHPELTVTTLVAVACRELLLSDDVRERAARLAGKHPAAEHAIVGSFTDMLAKLAEGIPVDGMEALLPVLRPDELTLLTDQLAEGTPVLVCDPEKVRARAADLIKSGREFLEASWSVAGFGGSQENRARSTSNSSAGPASSNSTRSAPPLARPVTRGGR
ncbi:putative transcription-repair coupling factor [Mycobacterium xenopi 3993]|nr:putative transcription-repair coupling factor [Mycobacterium xenopi 3993]